MTPATVPVELTVTAMGSFESQSLVRDLISRNASLEAAWL